MYQYNKSIGLGLFFLGVITFIFVLALNTDYVRRFVLISLSSFLMIGGLIIVDKSNTF